MNIELYKNHFDALFENPSDSIGHYSKRGYWIAKEILDNAILFVGLNPSYPHENYDESRRVFYDVSKQNHLYYKQIRKLHGQIVDNEIKISWTHYDLLILRETKQSKIEKLSRTEAGKEFIIRNLVISKMVLEKSQPKIIVVANTLSRKFLAFPGWCNYSFNWDDQIGTYRFGDESELSGTPVFFTSMLSGQRALDIGSRERLQWQIKRALRHAVDVSG